MYKLRGHHLFCLLGYKGMGYSQEYVENMTVLHQSLRDNPKHGFSSLKVRINYVKSTQTQVNIIVKIDILTIEIVSYWKS